MGRRKKHDPAPIRVPVTISFEPEVIRQIDRIVLREGISRTTLVNRLLKRLTMTDVEYYRELAKQAYVKFQEYQYLKEQAEEQKQKHE